MLRKMLKSYLERKKRDPESWLRSRNKRRRTHGQEYESSRGKRVPRKRTKEIKSKYQLIFKEINSQTQQHIFY
jgi:hypothetical protein